MEAPSQFKGLAIGVVLAAGMGKRMNSHLPKVAHLLFGKPLVIWAIESLIKADVKKLVVVISPAQKIVEQIIAERSFQENIQIKFAYQENPLGTGHAARCGVEVARHSFSKEIDENLNAKILIAYGDTPAVEGETFRDFLNYHSAQNHSFTVLAFLAKNPFGYGRILTDKNNNFLAIHEEKDCNDEEKKINLCNSGFLCANFSDIENILPQLKNDNSAKEFYLTDAPFISRSSGKKVGYMIGEDESEFLGINSQEQLAEMEIRFQKKYNTK
ncbi:sugar phosphate nucleotidyltransferase [Fluviispira multicolorata]|uniref:sugar phosphate nucleotidyltransferase n=1 Tax=Fluviispira multicolorata TaxID=2654512 RepID=UPI0013762382|nr:NTP transferase domain-containing protein [Fluviispira multicolorata]